MLRSTMLTLVTLVTITNAFAILPARTASASTIFASSIRSSSFLSMTGAQSKPLEIISDDTFTEAVIERSTTQPVLVDFFTDWCGPCKLIEPLLRKIDEEGDVVVVKAKPEDTKAFRKWLAKQGASFGVVALPHVILFENGKPSKSLVGRFGNDKLSGFLKDVGSSVRDLGSSVVKKIAHPEQQRQLIPLRVTDAPHPFDQDMHV